MERLTYDFALGGNHCWQVKGADNLECREVCERQGDDGCKTCPIAKAFDRLASYEETGLEPEEIIELKGRMEREKVNKCSLFDIDFAEIIEDAFGIPVDRLRELAEADREGRVHIYGKSHKCPICGAYRLVPRVDCQFYFCFHCKNQVTREDAQAALRREQDGE